MPRWSDVHPLRAQTAQIDGLVTDGRLEFNIRNSLLHFIKWNVTAARNVDPRAEESCFTANYILHYIMKYFSVVYSDSWTRPQDSEGVSYAHYHVLVSGVMCRCSSRALFRFPPVSGPAWRIIIGDGVVNFGSGTKGQISPGDLTAFLIKPHRSLLNE